MQKRGATFHRDSCSFAAYMCPEPFLLKIWGNHTQPQTMIGDVSSAEAFDTPTRLAWSSPHLGCVSYSRSRTDLSLLTFTHAMLAARFHLISLRPDAAAAIFPAPPKLLTRLHVLIRRLKTGPISRSR
jgi:hypothetical protein